MRYEEICHIVLSRLEGERTAICEPSESCGFTIDVTDVDFAHFYVTRTGRVHEHLHTLTLVEILMTVVTTPEK